MNVPYFLNIPLSTNAPSADQPNMQTNTNSISTLLNIDHVGFQQNNGGYHKVIHSTQFSSIVINPSNSYNNPPTKPAPIGLIGELYTVQMRSPAAPGGILDEVLFYQSGSGRITQLTNSFAPVGNQNVANYNGYTSLPGGLIIQWGFKNGTNGANHTFNAGDTGTVTFPIAFPTNIFSITTNMNFNSNTAGVPASTSAEIVAIDYFMTTTSQFAYKIAGSGSSYTVFYWIAIGN